MSIQDERRREFLGNRVLCSLSSGEKSKIKDLAMEVRASKLKSLLRINFQENEHQGALCYSFKLSLEAQS